jgi:RNA polymerase sigma-70 factor, ECF subfamily
MELALERQSPPLLRLLPSPDLAATAAVRQNLPMAPTAAPRPGPRTDGPDARLAALYGELRHALLAFLRKHTGDAQVAEDLLHDVVLKALAAGQRAETSPHNLTGWLYAVARNAAMDHHRRARPSEGLPEDLRAPEADEDLAALAALSNCLRPVAEALPETYRATLIAAEIEGLALAEVARDQGLSLSAVKTRASRGRRLLLEQLLQCCRISLSAHGEVLDYDADRVAACAPPSTSAVGGSRAGKARKGCRVPPSEG